MAIEALCSSYLLASQMADSSPTREGIRNSIFSSIKYHALGYKNRSQESPELRDIRGSKNEDSRQNELTSSKTFPLAKVPSEDLFLPPPLSPIDLQGYSSRTRTRLMSRFLSQEIRNLLPGRLQLYDTWTLVYSLEQHGASLHTLYSNSIPTRGARPGYILAVRDTNHTIFGAYVNEYFHPTEGKRFYGNGDCFLWKSRTLTNSDRTRMGAGVDGLELSDSGQESPFIRFQAFPYTGVNDFIIFCTPTFLSMGGGDGHYGIWLDDDLNRGVSQRSLTFGNEPLSDSGVKFDIIAVEVWRVG